MKTVSIGFTGSQYGMTHMQGQEVTRLLEGLRELQAKVLHHGDCIGADAQAHEIAGLLEYQRAVHPPIDSSKRAFCDGEQIFPVKTYLDRNDDIVRMSDVLIATPNTQNEINRSGTWYTIREARRQSKFIYIVAPLGNVIIDRPQEARSAKL